LEQETLLVMTYSEENNPESSVATGLHTLALLRYAGGLHFR
jgi:hypothetical protein